MSADKKYSPEARVRASAIGSLAMREHSCFELRQKLINKKHQPELVDALLLELIEDNSVSDLRYAESYWRSRSNKGYGPSRISKELSLKGVSDELIQSGKDQADVDYYAVIERVYTKKYRDSAWQDYKEKAKRQAFLYRRGFDTEFINHVIES